MQVLIVKQGALGDVVRTSYFSRSIKKSGNEDITLTWLTDIGAEPLLRFNPWIDKVVTSFDQCTDQIYDVVYSLDDEYETLQLVSQLNAKELVGAYISEGVVRYSENAAIWFDMGLLSKFGKKEADRLKKKNTLGHAEIFKKIFCVTDVKPIFYGDPAEESWAAEQLAINSDFNIAINPFAGGRWPSKELPRREIYKLIKALLKWRGPRDLKARIVLLGAGEDRKENENIAREFDSSQIIVVDTDSSLLKLAAVVGKCDFLISSDSLALHLGIAQHIEFVAFFAPTSAAEIDGFGLGKKIISTDKDYCSYKKDANNSTITSCRIYSAFTDIVNNIVR